LFLEKGFLRKYFTPLLRSSAIFYSLGYPGQRITFTCGFIFFIFSYTSAPFNSGIILSINSNNKVRDYKKCKKEDAEEKTKEKKIFSDIILEFPDVEKFRIFIFDVKLSGIIITLPFPGKSESRKTKKMIIKKFFYYHP